MGKPTFNLVICKHCCGNGGKTYLDLIKKLSADYDVQIKSYGYFLCHEKALDKKYGFDLESLHQHTYYCNGDSNEIIATGGSS